MQNLYSMSPGNPPTSHYPTYASRQTLTVAVSKQRNSFPTSPKKNPQFHQLTMGILDEQRSLCEDLERLEQACADRSLEEPRTVRCLLPRGERIDGSRLRRES